MSEENKEKDCERLEALCVKNMLCAGLYCVATPIGNLRDITLRALDVLAVADVIMCEDTRVTRKLLGAHQISGKRLERYNDHSDSHMRDRVISMIEKGYVVALASDAGMPLISDPGYKLVRACRDAGLYVTSLPGASASLSALQISGIPSDKFCFLGFLPSKTTARKKLLEEWVKVPASLIAFETAPRLRNALDDIAAVFGAREMSVVREISKKFEEVRRGTSEDLQQYYAENGAPKGEIVLVISAPVQKKELDDAVLVSMLREALDCMKVKEAAKFVAGKTGRRKSELYDMALDIVKDENR